MKCTDWIELLTNGDLSELFTVHLTVLCLAFEDLVVEESLTYEFIKLGFSTLF